MRHGTGDPGYVAQGVTGWRNTSSEPPRWLQVRVPMTQQGGFAAHFLSKMNYKLSCRSKVSHKPGSRTSGGPSCTPEMVYMLVPLFLWKHGLIQAPMFYISAYFEARRDAYYERLLSVSRDDDWTGWCRFFLEAVKAQAEENLAKAQGILDLYDKMKDRIAKMTRSRYTIHALDWIFERPIFRSTDFAVAVNIPKSTATRILDVLHKGGILRVIRPGRGRQAAMFMYPAILNIVEGKEVSDAPQ